MNEQRSILLVDDDEVVRDAAAAELRQAGYHVLSADDDVDAIALLIAFRPDLVLVDLSTPRRCGHVFMHEYQRVAAALNLPATPVAVFASPGEDDERVREVARRGRAMLLHKPLERDALLALAAHHAASPPHPPS